jgi:hypothetical protein
MNSHLILSFFLFAISQASSRKFIKNFTVNECKKCIHYQPREFIANELSPDNKCLKFGEKDILNGKIKYDTAKDCRETEEKCGLEGKYFEKDDFSPFKQFYYFAIYNYYPGYLFLVILKIILSSAPVKEN